MKKYIQGIEFGDGQGSPYNKMDEIRKSSQRGANVFWGHDADFMVGVVGMVSLEFVGLCVDEYRPSDSTLDAPSSNFTYKMEYSRDSPKSRFAHKVRFCSDPSQAF